MYGQMSLFFHIFGQRELQKEADGYRSFCHFCHCWYHKRKSNYSTYMKIGTNNTAITYEIDISNMEKKLFKESNITCTQYAVLIIFIVLQICSCKNRTVNRKS